MPKQITSEVTPFFVASSGHVETASLTCFIIVPALPMLKRSAKASRSSLVIFLNFSFTGMKWARPWFSNYMLSLKFRDSASHKLVEKGNSKGHITMYRTVDHPFFNQSCPNWAEA